MNISLTTISLGGGGNANNQRNKPVTVNENGTTIVNPDSGYDGMEKVTLTVEVEPSLESKDYSITANGSTTITPSEGVDGISGGTITVNVQPELESKNYNITGNGSTSITPTSGKDGISGGTITVNVQPPLQGISTAVTNNGTITYSPDSEHYGLSGVTVTTNVHIPEIQTKNYNITANGSTAISPDSPYEGISGGTITVAVPGPELEEKAYSITANGTTAITPSTGKYISGGSITVNVDTNYDNIYDALNTVDSGGSVLESKTYTITENGSTSITPTSGKAITGGTITVNVGGGSYKILDGNVDRAGLAEIGWDDESIGYAQDNAVNWFASQNTAHTVSAANKALYGVINHANHGNYRNNTDMEYLPYFETSGVTNMIIYFYEFSNLTNIPKINTSNVTNFMECFRGCKKLISIPKINTSGATSCESMFRGCSALELVPNIDTRNCTNFGNMFHSCTSLRKAPSLDTSKGQNMGAMFRDCGYLGRVDDVLGGPETYSISFIFCNCQKLEYIEGFDSSNISDFQEAFETCVSLKKINHLNLSNANSVMRIFGYSWDNMSLTDLYLEGSINISIDFGNTPLNDASCKSILTAASNTTNTNAKTLTLKSGRTIQDDVQGTYATMLTDCISKGWTIENLTINPAA